MANLQTPDPNTQPYEMYFHKDQILFTGWKEVEKNERRLKFEGKLNAILHKHKNTSSCNVIPYSINFGEPGSGGSARVSCEKNITFIIREGIYTQEGRPYYIYYMPRK